MARVPRKLAAIIVLVLVVGGFVGILQQTSGSLQQSSGLDRDVFLGVGAPAPISEPATLTMREAAIAPRAETSAIVDIDIIGRRVISTASLSLGVESVDEAVREMRTIAERLDGFVAKESTTRQNDKKFASVTIRIPQESFLSAIEQVEKLGRTLNKDIQARDVTEQFVDLDTRLQNAMIAEQRLVTILGRAERVGDILEVERELARVRLQIEQIQGQLTFLERRIELSTLSVSLTEEQLIAPPEFHPFLAAIYSAIAILGIVVQGLIVIIIVVGPFAVVAVTVYYFYKRRRTLPRV